MRKVYFIIIFSVLIFSNSLTGQDYLIKNYGPSEGLKATDVYSYYQDSLGFIWMGLTARLSRFDGQNFIVGLAEHFRNLMVCKDNQTVELLEVSENIKIKYIEQTEIVSLSFLLTALNILNECDLQYKGSKNH